MNAKLRPTLFLSHGSPMMALEPGKAGRFLQALGPRMNAIWGKPKAYVVVSPHTATLSPVVLGAVTHDTIHDFGGFPAASVKVVVALSFKFLKRLDAPCLVG